MLQGCLRIIPHITFIFLNFYNAPPKIWFLKMSNLVQDAKKRYSEKMSSVVQARISCPRQHTKEQSLVFCKQMNTF